MNKRETIQLIDAAGGDVAFARLLGIDSGAFQQRVNNWRRRGIPSSVVLAHYEVIKDLQSKVSSTTRARKSDARPAVSE